MTASRNKVLGFAQRTRKNLECIEKSREHGADVHLITQLTLSLLGLVVFPCEDKAFAEAAKNISLNLMEKEGWPKWRITEAPENIKSPKERERCLPTRTLDHLLHRLRNAIAHHHVEFLSENRNYEEAELKFADQSD